MKCISSGSVLPAKSRTTTRDRNSQCFRILLIFNLREMGSMKIHHQIYRMYEYIIWCMVSIVHYFTTILLQSVIYPVARLTCKSMQFFTYVDIFCNGSAVKKRTVTFTHFLLTKCNLL